MNIKRGTGYRQTMFRILLIGVVLFTFGAGNLPVVHAQDFILPHLTPYLSADGLTLYNAVPPLLVKVDTNPAMQGIKIPGPKSGGASGNLSAATATFSITYVPAGGTDLTGRTCLDFPPNAQVAFNAAAAIWSAVLQSGVPITIKACWANLGSSSTLGYSGGQPLIRDFSGAPQANTWYEGSLANALSGSDILPSSFDMQITYNNGFSWYFGTDANPPAGQYDLVTVAAHEIGHGLNFSGSADYVGGNGSYGYSGYPVIYDKFIEDSGGTKLTAYTNPSTALGTLLTSGSLWFDGTNANAANGGSRVRIYAPSPWNGGSSYSHLDYSTFAGTINSMMVYAIGSGSANHDTGPVTRGVLRDLGWPLPNHTVTFNANGGSGAMSSQTASVPTSLTLNTFTRTGFSFSGWNTIANGTGTPYANGATYSFSADITLYAQWTALPNHTVIFNSNGGTGSMGNQINNVSTALTLNSFTRTGYSFSGWNTASNGSGTAYADGATYSFAADVTLYAQWTALPNHTVTFNANGGSGSMGNQINNVPTALTSNAFTRTGFSFSNWNTAANGSGTPYANGATYSFAADITLYAQWTALPNHTVIFNSNGGAGSMGSQINNVPTALTLNTFTRTGFSFSGWNTNTGGTGTPYADGATYSFAADVTLYAQWTALPNHTVIFNSNGGTGSMGNQINNVPTALTLNTFTLSGFNFAGWNTAANGSGTPYADGATYAFSADISLYAQWSALPNHTVIFNSNGGSGSMSPQVAPVPTALALNTFTRAGFAFSGWNTAANGLGTPYADGAAYSFAADITLYAQWTALPNHTVTFNANGGSGSMGNQINNVPTALTANSFTRAGFSFTGWNTAANGLGTPYADGATYSFSADITLYAQWTALPNHTVIFNSNGGSGSMGNQINNVPTALTANSFTLAGFSFSGWNTAANGSGTAYADGATYSFAADITLYAQWTALPNHTVIFNANGGSGSMGNQINNVPTALTANTFTRTGFSFSGWNTAANGSGTAYANGATYSFAADVTLYAQWTALPNHTVTFNSNGGSGSMGNQINNVPTALTANTFTRAGFSFSGWNTAANGSGTAYANGATYSFAADVTLYAQWTTLPNHTVIFNANGGSGSMGNQINNVPTALTANTFTRAGFSFSGWNTVANGSGTAYANGATYSFAADVTLYAQWTTLPNHTVIFNANGGSGSMGNQINNVPTALTANTFTRAGFSFSGWNTVANGSGTAYANGATYSFAADVTLYAQWTALPNHTVIFNSNGGSGSMGNQINNVPTALTS